MFNNNALRLYFRALLKKLQKVSWYGKMTYINRYLTCTFGTYFSFIDLLQPSRRAKMAMLFENMAIMLPQQREINKQKIIKLLGW